MSFKWFWRVDACMTFFMGLSLTCCFTLMVLTAETAGWFLEGCHYCVNSVDSLSEISSKSSLPFDLACCSTNTPQLYSKHICCFLGSKQCGCVPVECNALLETHLPTLHPQCSRHGLGVKAPVTLCVQTGITTWVEALGAYCIPGVFSVWG